MHLVNLLSTSQFFKRFWTPRAKRIAVAVLVLLLLSLILYVSSIHADVVSKPAAKPETPVTQVVDTATAHRYRILYENLRDSIKTFQAKGGNKEVKRLTDKAKAQSGGVLVGSGDSVKCASLALTVDSLTVALTEEREGLEVVTGWYNEAFRLADSTITEKDKYIKSLYAKIADTVAAKNRELDGYRAVVTQTEKKYQREKDKNYSIGLSAGYGAGTKGLSQGVIAITFTKPIFKFKL